MALLEPPSHGGSLAAHIRRLDDWLGECIGDWLCSREVPLDFLRRDLLRGDLRDRPPDTFDRGLILQEIVPSPCSDTGVTGRGFFFGARAHEDSLSSITVRYCFFDISMRSSDISSGRYP